jgi:hypothetical protein
MVTESIKLSPASPLVLKPSAGLVQRMPEVGLRLLRRSRELFATRGGLYEEWYITVHTYQVIPLKKGRGAR